MTGIPGRSGVVRFAKRRTSRFASIVPRNCGTEVCRGSRSNHPRQPRCRDSGTCGAIWLSRSQIVDEALALLRKAVLEILLATQVPGEASAACELTTPTLTALEWAVTTHPLALSERSLQTMPTLVDAPSEPGAPLHAAAGRVGR